jgi:uncharacterized membrane protein (DUF4010 family)
MLATVAMLLRNALLLALVAPAVLPVAWLPFALMLAAGTLLALYRFRPGVPAAAEPGETVPAGVPAAGDALDAAPPPPAPDLRLESPFSIRSALQLGLLFVGLQVAGTLAQRTLGELGFYSVSVLGGLLSSSSAVASAAALAAQHTISPWVAATGAFLASLTSALVNWPLIARLSRSKSLKRRVAWALAALALVGVAGFLAVGWFGGWIRFRY